jgi:hypothetical protein
MKGQAFPSREAVTTFCLEVWVRMDSGQLFSIFNEWIERLECIIESGEEYDTE